MSARWGRGDQPNQFLGFAPERRNGHEGTSQNPYYINHYYINQIFLDLCRVGVERLVCNAEALRMNLAV